MNKEQLVAYIKRANERIKNELESDHDEKVKGLNCEYWLGARYSLLEILRHIDFNEYIKQSKTTKFIDKALTQASKCLQA